MIQVHFLYLSETESVCGEPVPFENVFKEDERFSNDINEVNCTVCLVMLYG